MDTVSPLRVILQTKHERVRAVATKKKEARAIFNQLKNQILRMRKLIIRRFLYSFVLGNTNDPCSSKAEQLIFKGPYDRTLYLYNQHNFLAGKVNFITKNLDIQRAYNTTHDEQHTNQGLQFHPSPLSILLSLIKAASHSQNHSHGLQLHCVALKTGADSDPVVFNSLISMYGKFSQVDWARKLFDEMPQRDAITWNSLINCYTQNGYSLESMKMFKEMCVRGFVPKPELIASLLSRCTRTGTIGPGKEIHAFVIVNGWKEEDSVFLSTALVSLYLRCHDSLMAFQVFDRMEVKNEVSWTTMISGCTANQKYDMALFCFRAMQEEGIKPNRVALVTILPLCTELDSIKHGKEIHGYAYRHGFNSEVRISAALIHMYCKYRRLLCPARLIFERSATKDVVLWSSIIESYSQSEDCAAEALILFHRMRMEGFQPNYVTLLSVVSACTSLLSASQGRGVHGHILKSGLAFDQFVGNSLLNMYSKCGCLMDSHRIFKEMNVRDNFSWSIIIGAYGIHGHGEEALRVFHEMLEEGVEPDAITFLAVLSACNHAGLVEEGQKLFGEALKDEKISLGIEHYACHIDLLGRAGKVEDACEVVRAIMPMKPSMRIWSSLVSACKVHGRLGVAEMLAHQLVKLEPENAANYALLSMVYAESGNWLGVEEVRKEMRIKGLRKSYGFSRIELENEQF